MLDKLIRNGQVLDGTGKRGYAADVAIQGDRIVDVGHLPGAQAEVVIDASGKVVAPGFIDMHSHADMLLPVAPDAESLIHQGITTVVTGQCGASPAPLLEMTRRQVIEMIGEEDVPMPWNEWSTFGSYLDYLQKTGISVNMAPLVGQGMVRSAVMGFSAARPNEDQIEAMQHEVVSAMEAGAIGVSTGLIYPPGSYAAMDELIEITKPVGERKGFYFSHIRGEGDTLLEAITEAIEIGRKTGSPVEISHFKAAGADNWWKAGPALELIDKARLEGLDVTADMYPYLAGSTGLVALLPEWAQEGGKDAISKRLLDPETRTKMTGDMKTGGFFRIAEWDKVLISDSRTREYAGRYISELSEEVNKTPYDWVFDALLETEGEIGMIVFMMSEENVRMQLPHPAMMIGTDGVGLAIDGPLAKGVPHPRNFGTFARILGQYVREEKILTLENAIFKMTGLPAKKLQLMDRGLVKKNHHADLVVFDAEIVSDLATYPQPFQYPSGFDHVLVNGELVLSQGKGTGARPGRMISR
ncbi:MAG: D-aminoacylase [Chloroflexi bacterium]|nr:D-aminoacylase [Chloroflexota bacterium]